MFWLIWILSGIVASLIMRTLLKVVIGRWTNGDRLICYSMLPLGLVSLSFAVGTFVFNIDELFVQLSERGFCKRLWDWLNEDVSEK